MIIFQIGCESRSRVLVFRDLRSRQDLVRRSVFIARLQRQRFPERHDLFMPESSLCHFDNIELASKRFLSDRVRNPETVEPVLEYILELKFLSFLLGIIEDRLVINESGDARNVLFIHLIFPCHERGGRRFPADRFLALILKRGGGRRMSEHIDEKIIRHRMFFISVYEDRSVGICCRFKF